ncbi:hypothetical protein EJB05_45347, partial [Eragrostis curvula]
MRDGREERARTATTPDRAEALLRPISLLRCRSILSSASAGHSYCFGYVILERLSGTVTRFTINLTWLQCLLF